MGFFCSRLFNLRLAAAKWFIGYKLWRRLSRIRSHALDLCKIIILIESLGWYLGKGFDAQTASALPTRFVFLRAFSGLIRMQSKRRGENYTRKCPKQAETSYLVDAQASLRAQCIWTIFIDGKPCQPRGLHSILACQRNALALQPLLSSESNLCELLWNR